MNVWVLMGEEGYLYGVFASELDAWAYVADGARRCYFEAGYERCPENIEDVALFWTIESHDARPHQRTLVAREHVAAEPAIGEWYLESIDLDLADLPAFQVNETVDLHGADVPG